MSAVSPAIVKTIIQLQSLPSLANFSLAGGTNLALQYNHRISDDIDLFCPEIIGLEGFNKIQEEVKASFRKNARNFDNPCDINDQYSFLRFFIDTDDGTMIKVDVLQNMKHLFEIETINEIRLFSKADIGLYKLVSLSNRSTKKDIYDLDFITDEIPLATLFAQLKEKRSTFCLPEHQCLFDLVIEKDVLEEPLLLIKFDELQKLNTHQPSHTHDRIDISEGNKTWAEARLSWRMKVRRLFSDLGKDFPKPEGMEI